MKRRNFIKNSGFTVGSSVLLAGLMNVNATLQGSATYSCDEDQSFCGPSEDTIVKGGITEIVFVLDAQGNPVQDANGRRLVESIEFVLVANLAGQNCGSNSLNCTIPYTVTLKDALGAPLGSLSGNTAAVFNQCPSEDVVLSVSGTFTFNPPIWVSPGQPLDLILNLKFQDKICVEAPLT